MFYDDSFGGDSGNYEKKIKVYLNGDFLCKPIEVKLTRRMKDIRRAVQDQFGFQGTKVFRLFNEKGVELFEEDLEFLEADTSVYASKGAEFDTNSCLSEYDLQRELGEGGFGKVWLGVHKQSKEKVAIKILNTGHIQNASEMDQVFREAEVMQTLEHNHIVQIKSCFSIRQQVIFIMEYMQGGELLERVENAGRFDEQEAQIYFKQICSAMEYCHRLKLIHRDLKLENLLCTKSEEKICKVADFGIAGVASNQSSDNIDAGSLRYMAPEVLSGRLKVPSTAVDIWSMGVILYAMVVGDLPFNGKDNREIVDRICEGKYDIPRDIKKNLSAECLDVLEKCLEMDYTKRIKAGNLMQHPWVKDHTLEDLMKDGEEGEEEEMNEDLQKEMEKVNIQENEEEEKREDKQDKKYNSKYGSSSRQYGSTSTNTGSRYGQKQSIPNTKSKTQSGIGGSSNYGANKGSQTTKNSTQTKKQGSTTTPKTPGQTTKTFTQQTKIATKSKY